MDPLAAHHLRRDFCTAQETVRKGVSAGRATSTKTGWNKWVKFTASLGLDPYLETFEDKVPLLQIFAQRVRTGELAAKGDPIRARSVEDYVRFVGQTFASVGTSDPRLNTSGKQDFRLTRTWAAWKREDPAPDRVKPVPIQVIRHLSYKAALPGADESFVAVVDMIVLAFFYLLRPGEYTDSSSESTPFRFTDAQLFIGDCRLDLVTTPAEQLRLATFATLTFTDQKNGVRNEVIGLGCSGDAFLCPVKTIVRRVIYLRSHNANGFTPLCRVFHGSSVTPTRITSVLRSGVAALGTDLGFLPSDVSARCLRAAGAMALLLSDVDTNVIQLIGRWRSDAMLRYLHIQAAPLMRDYSRRMLSGGNFSMIPNQLIGTALVPQHA